MFLIGKRPTIKGLFFGALAFTTRIAGAEYGFKFYPKSVITDTALWCDVLCYFVNLILKTLNELFLEVF